MSPNPMNLYGLGAMDVTKSLSIYMSIYIYMAPSFFIYTSMYSYMHLHCSLYTYPYLYIYIYIYATRSLCIHALMYLSKMHTQIDISLLLVVYTCIYIGIYLSLLLSIHIYKSEFMYLSTCICVCLFIKTYLRNRHCRTSPVVLEGCWGQVWPKIGRKPAQNSELPMSR